MAKITTRFFLYNIFIAERTGEAESKAFSFSESGDNQRFTTACSNSGGYRERPGLQGLSAGYHFPAASTAKAAAAMMQTAAHMTNPPA